MSDSIRVRHTVTELVRDMSVAEFDAIAFTPLHLVWEVVDSDVPVDCDTCGDGDEPEEVTEEISELGDDEYNYEEDDK